MVEQQRPDTSRSDYSPTQYLFYTFVGVLIWISGVILIRVLGPDIVSQQSAMYPVLFVLSIPLGVVTQLVIRLVCRLPMREMLIPAFVMIFMALLLDGLAIGFTNLYGPSIEMELAAAGWLLWTFGAQVLISMWMVARAIRS
jgi:hypothetical protein